MKKVLFFSFCLICGLILSQLVPGLISESSFVSLKHVSDTLLHICLGFIMINVGREFEIDKTRWKSYSTDYLIAMGTAAAPWVLIALYYIFVIISPDIWGKGDTWKETFLLTRFAAPTSAGILFTMLVAAGLKKSWVYNKIQVLAIFDDLDTIILMIPLQMLMIGLKWQMFAILIIVFVLLVIGWKYLNKIRLPEHWGAIIIYSAIIYLLIHLLDKGTGIHIEILLPTFMLGVVMKETRPVHDTHDPMEIKVSSTISFLFMFLVGMSMPAFIGVDLTKISSESIIGNMSMLPWGTIAIHVVAVTILSNIGKLFPLFFYRDHTIKERLALSVGMFARGEVGAGVIFIALGYGIGGPLMIISVLTMALNLLLTVFFIIWVKNLTLKITKESAS